MAHSYAPGCPSSCGSTSWTSYLPPSLLELLTRVITATIQVPSSASAPLGGRKTTFLPGCKGCGFTNNESFFVLESRKCDVGPTELVLGGKVIETERVFPDADWVGTGVPDGDGALGRLFLFSAVIECE